MVNKKETIRDASEIVDASEICAVHMILANQRKVR
jgi:hypothetical protein